MPKIFNGVVSAISGNKTIAVKVELRKTHAILRKQYIDTKKYMVHDETNEALVGDKVSIIECRPLSATKHFKLERILVRPALREEALAVIKEDSKIAVKSKPKAPVKIEKFNSTEDKKSVKS
jgi:small subunit ribosomal protein S17